MKNRNQGLDIARALAIILVLIGHGLPMFSDYFNTFPAFTWTGYIGVEIFFVLSGFLIGQIIIKSIVNEPSWRKLGEFYVRRWLRTLPLYFLIISVLVLSGKKIYPHYFVFLQNFELEVFSFFPVTWSLAFEEWFYLLAALLFFIVFKSSKRFGLKKIFFIVSISFIILFSVLRIFYVLESNPTWNFGVRANIFIRLDCIMYGVVLAGLKTYHKEIFNKFTKNNFVMFLSALGLIVFGAVYVHIMIDSNRIDTSLMSRTVLFTIVSIFATFFVGCLSSNSFINNIDKNYFTETIKFVSITSYSVYLTHYEIYNYIQPFAVGKGFFEVSVIFLGWVFISYIISFFLYKYFEKPILDFRDKLTKKKIN